jgi:hypothetical protein
MPILVPFTPPRAGVLFSASGSGYGAGNNSVTSGTWNHVVGPFDNQIIVGIASMPKSATDTLGAQMGATSMTQVGSTYSINPGGGYFMYMGIFQLALTPGASVGLQTMTASFSGGSSTSVGNSANSFSFRQLTSFGTLVTATADSSSLSQTVSASATSLDLVFQMFCWDDASVGNLSLFNYNQTTLWNVGTAATFALPTIMGTAPGAASVSFTATAPSANFWAGIAVPLLH